MKKSILLATVVLASAAHGYEAQIKKGELPATLEAMVEKANTDTGVTFDLKDFALIEDRELATSKFRMYVQTNNFVPVNKTAIRLWSDKNTNDLILAEIHLDENAQKKKKILAEKYARAKFSPGAMKSRKLSQAISELVSQEVSRHSTDNRVLGMKFKDYWTSTDLIREVEVRGRRGIHHISISLLRNVIVEKSYMEFPQSEVFHTLKANVFPIYEEVEGTGEKLPYEVRELKYVNYQVPEGGENPLAALENSSFPEDRYHPILAETPIGQFYNFWSEAIMRRKVEEVVGKLPVRSNDVSQGLLLQGKYVTINLHPGVKEFKDIEFPLKSSPNHIITWQQDKMGSWFAKPVSGKLGKQINSEDELLTRIPVRLSNHDPVSYINSGFDEAQVYYGVTVLMEALAEMGFQDPELSTKPFHAFLYDPDISMKDNAYYYDNTINFTTYNPGSPNLARDNPTIWQELGHGVMDRPMGAHLGFAGSRGGYGGLSEGMADFVAMLVVQHQTDGADFPGKSDFRIINNTGFYLTNEFHDEGEAYGGAMNDMLNIVLAKEGRAGLHAFTDLTLEAMRLARNHPALSPQGWFEHMLYADELGSEVRAAGQFRAVILDALVSRNFSFSDSFRPADVRIEFNGTELTNASLGSRDNPIKVQGSIPSVAYDLQVTLKAGDANFIEFPATVKVEFKKGALQGAIAWEGEESNPLTYQVNSPGEILTIPPKASMQCETSNQPDGSCKDYAYIQIYNQGETKPKAKRRFYLQLKSMNLAK